MDIGTFRGVITVVLLIAFIALVVWLFVLRSRKDFDSAANIPLDDSAKDGDRE